LDPGVHQRKDECMPPTVFANQNKTEFSRRSKRGGSLFQFHPAFLMGSNETKHWKVTS
jgi:hypothetical protein